MDNTTSPTIFIADDDPFIIKAFKAGLELHDYKVVIAIDGEDALRQIPVVQPDLILLDVIMPKKDGFEVLKALKADPAVASIPVVMLTSLTQESDEQTAREYGAVDFLVKSNVSLNEILQRVQRSLEQAAAAAASAAPAASSVPDLPVSGEMAAETVEAEDTSPEDDSQAAPRA